MDFLDQTLERVQAIRHGDTPGQFIKQRIAQSADTISNRARIQAQVETANEALCKMASVCYETIDRIPVNFDAKSYRLLIPSPWGDTGYAKWGMRAVEARILRAVLMERARRSEAALFDYADRRWFINASVYPSAKTALQHLHAQPITAGEWLHFVNAWHTKEKRRKYKEVKRK